MSYARGSQDSLVSYAPESQDSLGSYALGSHKSWSTEKSKMVLCTGESSSVSLNLQAHATDFKETLIQKLSNSSINYTNTYILFMFEKFPLPKIYWSTPWFPSTGESFWKSNNSVKNQ